MKKDVICTGLTDEEAALLAKGGDKMQEERLIGKYKRLVILCAKSYYLEGADRDDIIQEGTIGLFRAIRDFEQNKETSFYTYAKVCITRQIYTAIKAAARKKHSPLSGYLSLDEGAQESIRGEASLTNPEEIFINKEDKEYLEKAFAEKLSSLENEILALYVDGKSYKDIGAIVGKNTKAVDNAVQRIKSKLTLIRKQNND